MRTIAIAFVAAMFVASCAGAQKLRVMQAPKHQLSFAVPNGWKAELDTPSPALNAPCDVRLTDAAASADVCAIVVPAGQEQFMDLDADGQAMLKAMFEGDGWTDVVVRVEKPRQLLSYGGTKPFDLDNDGQSEAMRVVYLRMAHPGSQTLAVALLAISPAAHGPRLDAAVTAFADSLASTAAKPAR